MHARDNNEILEALRIRHILQAARKKKHISQEKMCELVGVSKATYVRYENDFKSACGYIQDDICKILDLPNIKIFEEVELI